MTGRHLWRTVAALGLLALAGCFPAPQPVPLPKDESAMNSVLSELILAPRTTCEELRDAFDVEVGDLPAAPDEIGLPYLEHWLTARDGATLRVWYVPARLDRGTVIVAQGSAGQMPCYLFTVQMLSQLGWSVVTYDYRGFGGSDGRPDVAALAPDLEDVLDWTLAETGREQVTLFGISLGSMPCVAVAVDRPEAVNGVILDSPVAMSDQLNRLEFVLHEQINAFLSLINPKLVSETIISRMESPTLFFLCEADVLTRPQAIELLYLRAGGVKQMIRYPGLGHARAQYRDPSGYSAHLERFLSAVWGQAPLTAFSPHDSLTAVPWVEFILQLRQRPDGGSGAADEADANGGRGWRD